MLRKNTPDCVGRTQIVLPHIFRPRLVNLTHSDLISGNPGQKGICKNLRRRYYCPQKAADVNASVLNTGECSRTRLQLLKRTNQLKLFRAKSPLISVGIDILGPLPKANWGRRFLLLISDRFTKITQAVPLKYIDANSLARAFSKE